MSILGLLFIIMKKRKFLQRILDTTLKSNIKKIFGEKSFIKISNVSYVRSQDIHIINATLYLYDIEGGMPLYPDGLDVIIKQAWDVIGDKKPIRIHSSVDVFS
jgi:hypothetical protein